MFLVLIYFHVVIYKSICASVFKGHDIIVICILCASNDIINDGITFARFSVIKGTEID